MKSALIVTLFLIQARVVQGFSVDFVAAIVAFLCSLPFISFLCDITLGEDVDPTPAPSTPSPTPYDSFSECNENTALERLCFPAADCESSPASISPETIRSKAEAFALVQSTEPTASAELVEQFVTSLEIIAMDHAYLKPRFESPIACLPWVPSEIIVGFTDEATEEIAAGTYDSTELDQLNEDWGLVEIDASVYRFDKLYNSERLASIYETIPGIEYADPNYLIGAGPRDVVNNEGTRFTFSVGWGDCPSGCIFVYSWSFLVDNNEGRITQMDKSC